MVNVSRRHLLAAGAALPSGILLGATPAQARTAAAEHASQRHGLVFQNSEGALTVPSDSLISATSAHPPQRHGIEFQGSVGALTVVRKDMAMLLEELHIRRSHVALLDEASSGRLLYTLTTPENDFDTLSFTRRPEFWVGDSAVEMPVRGGRTKAMSTVSQKEILLSLLQHGRLTVFSGSEGSVDALREHILLRQHIVAWAQNLSWGWPDGGSAYWNKRLWDRGTPRSVALTHAALLDTLTNQEAYGIGCYTAAKMVYAGAILDFYQRVVLNKGKAQRVLKALWSDGDPLVGIEPGAMWAFEPSHTPQENARPGKLLTLAKNVAPRNFVPGDWTYFWNTDPVTYEKTGYEGSNTIYLGRGRFSDYYNDNEHSFTYEQKLDDVYQWRNHVFSRRRDFEKAVILTDADLNRLSLPPEQGGLLLPYRAVPVNAGLL